MMYDIKTKNISFLQMSKKLKDNGVSNNKFMLLLYDDDIAGVDPFSDRLTPLQKAKIYKEICTNYWYFLREIAMVPQEGSLTGTHFILNLANLAISFCNLNNCNTVVIIPRQQGKTVAEVFFSTWVQLFSGSYIQETYLHKNQDGANSNLARFKKYKELLPKWLVNFISDKNDKDNIEEKYFSKKKNGMRALASAHSDADADKLGRGSSTAMVYFDEFAFLERNKIIINAMIPAWSTSKSVAQANGAPYGIRITTTPNNLSLPQAAFCYEYISNAVKFSFNMYDIPANELHDYITKNSGNDFVYIKYTYKQLDLDDKWYNEQLRAMNNDKLNAIRELDCEWPESSDGNVFDVNQLEKIKKYLKPVLFKIRINGRDISFFEKPNFLLNYIITCDCSGGLSQDRSVISIVDPTDFRLVGLFFNANIDTDSFRQMIESLALNYFSNAIINIENNSMGIALLDILMKNPKIEPRLYCEEVERKAEITIADGEIKKKKEKKISYGTNTNANSRKSMMLDLLPAIVDDEPQIFVSEDFYEEIKNLVRNKRGKIEARQNFHDDIIMSYLVFRYSLVHGKIFQTKFHINMRPSASNASIENVTCNIGRVYGAAMEGDMLANNESRNFEEEALLMMNTQLQCDRSQGYVTEEQYKQQKDSNTVDFLNYLNNL